MLRPRHRMQPGGPGVRQAGCPVLRRTQASASRWRSCPLRAASRGDLPRLQGLPVRGLRSCRSRRRSRPTDGIEFHNQLFLPKDLKPGERRPAIVFVHGGPMRQMLLGYHYMDFYHMAYAVNQWLASQGYVVMSVNYRSGIGYGRVVPQRAQRRRGAATPSTRTCSPRASICRRGPTWTRSASASGGFPTAACSPRRRWRATPTSSPPAWTWPASTSGATRSTRATSSYQVVGDLGDRQVEVAGAAHGTATTIATWPSRRRPAWCSCCARHNVYHELIVFPDDMHESLLYGRWMTAFHATDDFLKRSRKNGG